MGDFQERYQITSLRGKVYGREEMRAAVRREMGGFPAEHVEAALGYLDDDRWMRFRRGSVPSAVVSDILRELYG